MPRNFQSGGSFIPGADVQFTGAMVATGQILTRIDLPADGVVPIFTGVVRLTKGSAGAYTLAAPTADQDGTELYIAAGTAAAHVVTATALLQNGVTGGPKTTATFGAFIGSGMVLLAVVNAGSATGTWYVKGAPTVVVLT